MFEKFIEKIRESKNILIFVHINPDGDCLGSACGLARALEKCNKRVNILLERELIDRFSILEGPFIQNDKVNISEYDLKIAVDSATPERLNGNNNFFFGNTMCFDHHKGNSLDSDLCYIDDKAAATGEIIFDLIKEMKVEIDSDIANSLYSAILTDTGGFMYSNTTARTHLIAAELIEKGADVYELNKKLMIEKPLRNHKVDSKCVELMEFYCGGKICIALLTNEICRKLCITSDDLNGVPALLKSVSGVEAAVLLSESEEGIIKGSIRTDKNVDASSIAEKFGGGGHIRAAGFRVNNGSIYEIKEQIIKEVIKEI